MIFKHLTIIAVLVLVSSTAFAGFVREEAVTIDEINMVASGNQWTARTADNDTEMIGCGVRAINTPPQNPYTYGFCQARDANGDQVMCYTYDEVLLNAIRGLSSFSYITFNWDADSICTLVGMSTQSFYLPLFKTKRR